MIEKDIDLCGLGNGLVDLLYEVSFEELENLGLRKGEMRLVDASLQNKLFEVLKGKEHHKCSGGSAANTIIAFTQFGGKSAYHTVLGNDENGRFYLEEFRNLNIELVAPMIDEPTGTCIVLITPDSERTMNTSLGATAHFGPEHINPSFIERAKWIYLEGYKFTAPKSTQALYYAIDVARASGSKIALTLSDVFVVNNFYPQVLDSVHKVDLLFCNEQEAKALAQQENFGDIVEFLKRLVPNFVITRGENGSFAWVNAREYEFQAYKADPIDTTGAGDMYAAGFLYGLIKKNNVEFAGKLASYASAHIVSQLGARLRMDHKILVEKVENK
jgi:sugar/nucleoside kinase (ribokinase family)